MHPPIGAPGKPGMVPGPKGGPAAGPLGLNLTDAQKAQMEELRKQFQDKLAKVLTPEQKAQVDKARDQWKKRLSEKGPEKGPEKK
jgi:Spy/CpxP family protein refolding chaperone